MTDTEDALESEVEEFLRQADAVYEEYDQGYADADASLRQLRRHLDDLRAATGDD
jgi:phage gp29-like protein